MGRQSRILTLALLSGGVSAASTPANVLYSPESSSMYDYIIAGAGTSGLVLANRLSANGTFLVAVIEPGEDVSTNANVTLVASTLPAIGTQLDWQYPVAAQDVGPDAGMTWHSGKAIGGSSAINGMGYVRGDRAVVDAWEALGNPGWNWDTLLPYYIKSQNFTAPLPGQEVAGALYDPAVHGTAGPVDVAFAWEELHADMYQTFRRSWGALGYAANGDVNRGEGRGLSVAPMTVQRDAHVREDAGTAYYQPAKARSNLVLVPGSVRKINWKPKESNGSGDDAAGAIEAAGVEYVTADQQVRTLTARKEVILAAGVIKTPLILELSGVGAPSILASRNITTRVDLPGVGENLQDKPQAQLIYSPADDLVLEASSPALNPFHSTDVAPYLTFANAHDLLGDSFAAVRSETAANLSAWASAISAVNNINNTSALETILRVQHDMIFSQNSSIAEVETTIAAAAGYYVSVFWPVSPFSRGSVHINPSSYSSSVSNSTSVLLPEPEIDPKYL